MTGIPAWRAHAVACVAAAVSKPSTWRARALTIQSRWRSDGLEEEALVAAAEDGSFAAFVDDDEGLRAGGVGNGDEAGVYAGAFEFALMEATGIVFADFADVTSVESPGLAGDDGGSGLAAGHDAGVGELGFGSSGGEMGEGDEGVDCVQSDADEVDLWSTGHLGNCIGGERCHK